MHPADFIFYGLAINPIGGLFAAIPFAVLKLHYSAWRAVLIGVPLSYVQVIVIDGLWTLVSEAPALRRFLERQRSPRVERLVAARGGFWVTFLATPFIGPWVIMAFMRYAHVRQRTVALPMFLALAATGATIAVASVWLPQLFAKAVS
jgi:hypothetical protein